MSRAPRAGVSVPLIKLGTLLAIIDTAVMFGAATLAESALSVIGFDPFLTTNGLSAGCDGTTVLLKTSLLDTSVGLSASAMESPLLNRGCVLLAAVLADAEETFAAPVDCASIFELVVGVVGAGEVAGGLAVAGETVRGFPG